MLPESIATQVINWSHQVLYHPDNNRMRDAIQAGYHHPDLRSHIDTCVCEICQMNKLSGKGLALFSERDVNTHPWHEVAVNLIGP